MMNAIKRLNHQPYDEDGFRWFYQRTYKGIDDWQGALLSELNY